MRPVFVLVLLCWCTTAVLVHAKSPSTATTSFAIYTYPGGPAAEEVSERCEALREQLQSKWLADSAREPWQPRCEIVLHGTQSSYVGAIGRAGMRTKGSSLIRSNGRQITHRRIDLLVDQQNQMPALSHEMTHVVLADHFGDNQMPLWADEGVATLADSATKQSLHQRDCLQALNTGTFLRLSQLVQMEKFASPHQVPAFYGQSLSLVQFLLERDESAKLVPFLSLAKERGYDHALRVVYGIEGIAHLETLWREFAINGG